MRPSLVISLLLLSLLLSNAQGIRLDKGSVVVQQKKQQNEESALLKRSDSTGVEDAILCKDGQCTGTMRKRVSKVSRKSYNRIPSIHEDYYGPAHHRPRHH